jgi:YVTN family beta-propeller protein
MRYLKSAVAVCTLVSAAALAASNVIAQQNAVRQRDEDVRSEAVRTRSGLRPSETILFNGWGLTPAGTHVPLEGDMPLKMVVSPDGRTLAAATGGYNGVGLSLLDIATRKVTQFVPLARAWNGLAWSRDGKRLFVAGGNSGLIHVFDYADGKVTLKQSIAPQPEDAAVGAAPQPSRRQRRQARAARRAATPETVTTPAPAAGQAQPPASAPAPAAAPVPTRLPTFLAGISVHPTTGKLYVCNEGTHEIWVLNADTLRHEDSISVGAHPHSCVVGGNRRYLYVSNWGGRSVSVVDVQTNERLRDINVGVRPNDMALAKDGRLFVACAGDNTVHVINTGVLETPEQEADPSRRPPEGTREIIATSLYPSSPEGSTPDGVAVSPDGKTLFVANADNNNVLVADISDPEVTNVTGFLPVGWYPTAVAVSPDNNTLFVANGKGLLSHPSFPASKPRPSRLHTGIEFSHPGRLLDGSVSFITRPTPTEQVKYTEQVRKNSPYTPETLLRAPYNAKDTVVPTVVGAPSPIKHVLYIIKENRTYDQVYGDMKDASGKPIGNGDPKITMYGENVTPNQHQLAREYVLLDNLFCNSEVSVDGHSWTDAAIATDWNQRSWTMSYSRHGSLPGNPETATPTAGYLWDLCRRNGVSFKTYGEGSNRVPTVNRGTWKAGRDMNKVDGWIADLHAAERTGNLPQFMIMSLGENHTQGRTPGAPTPESCVASNDIGVGKIVAAASRSKFWKEMAIFIVEDDAQNGPDHVDAHRTAGLVISPYTKRAAVDSTLYTQVSMIRTMELLLGLHPLTQYDAGATPMFRCFGTRANVVAFEPRTPQVDLKARNPATGAAARASERMNFAEYDDFDTEGEDTLNRILWAAAKGPNVPYPAPVHRAVFTR